MKEKRILIAVLLSMAFQAEAARVRGVYENPVDDASEEAPVKKEMKKKKEQRKEAVQDKKEKRTVDAKESKRKYRNEGHEQTDEQLAPRKEAKEEKHKKVRDQRQEGTRKEERKKEGSEKKESKDMSRIEHRDAKKKDDDQKQKEMRNKKRSELEKSIKQLEEKIDVLENKKADALREEEEDRADDDKEAPKSHVINHGSVKVESLDREMKNHKEMLARKEEAHAKLSNDTREDKRDEHRKRASLAKIYENNQRDLREEHAKLEDAIKALRVEEVEVKNELQADRPAHEDLLVQRRHAETRHDSAEAEHHGKMLLAKESDEMKALHAKQKRILKDLAALTKKINANDKAREEAAKEAGIKLSLRKERHEKEVDRMITEGVRPEDNHHRILTETTVKIQHRKEDIAHEKMVKDMSMKKGSSSKSMKKRDDNKMSEKKVVRKKRPMPMNDAARDMSMIEGEDQDQA